MRATVELATERGMAALTLTDIVQRAGVARSTFYEHFADKQQCFLATFDYAASRVLGYVFAAAPKGAVDYPTAAHLFIARLLALYGEEPGLVRLLAGDAEALGPAAAERQRQIRGRLADGLVAAHKVLLRGDPQAVPITQLRAIAIVGAITEVMQHTLYTSGIEAIATLQAELGASVLALLEGPPA
jgi:AcrR family transcriptional regulator